MVDQAVEEIALVGIEAQSLAGVEAVSGAQREHKGKEVGGYNHKIRREDGEWEVRLYIRRWSRRQRS